MQKKTITKTITTKLDEWLKTITDQKLQEDVKKNLIVSGGSIASMFLGEKVNDFDIFLQDVNVLKRLVEYYATPFRVEIFDGRNKPALIKTMEDNYDEEFEKLFNARKIAINTLKDDQIKLFLGGGGKRVNEEIKTEDLNYHPVFFSPNAISLSNDIQIVVRFWGSPEKVHETFDYIHATNYFTYADGVVTNLAAMESLLTRQLKYQGSHYPLTSIIRARKFIKRNWNIGAGELLKIMYQISLLDLNDPDVLEEQLIGVDVAYFYKLITLLRGKQDTDPTFKMTYAYLCAIIDKIFGDE